MITELTQEQIDKLPYYVEKWTKINLSTAETDVDAVKPFILEQYKIAKLAEPKYFFKFRSPIESAHAIFMVDTLSEFNDDCKDTKVYTENQNLINIFNEMYSQYSGQYTEKDVTWNDDTKARMLSMVSQAYTKYNVNDKLLSYYNSFLYGAHDASWLSFYDFFYEEFGLECIKDLVPLFEIAKRCGWWSAYSEAVFVQDLPSSVVINEQNSLHNENGPAVEYRDGHKIYCLEGYFFDELVIMDPHLITAEMIESEEDSEKRRIMLQRFGYEKYFQSAECQVLDQDTVAVAVNDDRKMPRMLIKTKNSDHFLVGTDGSTQRVYVMPVGREVSTCKEAHELICGYDEEDCLAQS